MRSGPARELGGKAWLCNEAGDPLTPSSLPCPYPTPMELLSWAKLFAFLDLDDVPDDVPNKSLRYWEECPPFRYDFQKLGRIISLIGLTQRIEVKNGRIENADRFDRDYFSGIDHIENVKEKAGLRNLVTCLYGAG